jgi:hypothetical protein
MQVLYKGQVVGKVDENEVGFWWTPLHEDVLPTTGLKETLEEAVAEIAYRCELPADQLQVTAAVNVVDEAPESHDDAFWDTKQPGQLDTQDTNFPAGEINQDLSGADPWANRRQRQGQLHRAGAHPSSHPRFNREGDEQGSSGSHPHADAAPVWDPNAQVTWKTDQDYQNIAQQYGQVTPGEHSNLKFYDYTPHTQSIDDLAKAKGYDVYLAGGKYEKPDLEHRNYNTGHLMVYDPTPGSGGTFDDEQYTKAWRTIHELAHAQVYEGLNEMYGEGRRIGKLGWQRSPREAKRAVHWEWLAAHRQRELAEEYLDYHVPDEVFNMELNTVMHDAVHRAITGKFTNPDLEGFVPSKEKVPLEVALGMIDEAARKLGLPDDESVLTPEQKKELRQRKAAGADDETWARIQQLEEQALAAYERGDFQTAENLDAEYADLVESLGQADAEDESVYDLDPFHQALWEMAEAYEAFQTRELYNGTVLTKDALIERLGGIVFELTGNRFPAAQLLDAAQDAAARMSELRGRGRKSATQRWYHGSDAPLDGFDAPRPKFSGAVFLSPTPSFAALHGPHVYEAFPRVSTIFEGADLVRPDARYWPPDESELTPLGRALLELVDGDREVVAWAVREGYDIIEDARVVDLLKRWGYDAAYVQGDGPRNLMVFDPHHVELSQRKSATPSGHELGDLTEDPELDNHTRQPTPRKLDDAFRWNESYSSENQFEDPNLKLGQRADEDDYSWLDDDEDEGFDWENVFPEPEEGQGLADVLEPLPDPEPESPDLLDRVRFEFEGPREWPEKINPRDPPEVEIRPMVDNRSLGYLVLMLLRDAEGRPFARVTGANIAHGLRGYGLGKQMYRVALDWVRDQNAWMESDTAVSEAARRVWRSLMQDALVSKRFAPGRNVVIHEDQSGEDFPWSYGRDWAPELHQQYRSAQRDRMPVACVDLDGTILEDPDYDITEPSGQPGLGEPKRGAASALQSLKGLGWTLIIHTARFSKARTPAQAEQMRDEIEDHLQRANVPFDDVATGPKPIADYYIDDKAVAFNGDWWATTKRLTVQGQTSGYAYHTTPHQNLDDIAREGLMPYAPDYGTDQEAWPDGGEEDRIYFSPTEQGTEPFQHSSGQPILRVPMSAISGRERYTGDMYARHAIPPSVIEVRTEDGYVPIQSFVRQAYLKPDKEPGASLVVVVPVPMDWPEVKDNGPAHLTLAYMKGPHSEDDIDLAHSLVREVADNHAPFDLEFEPGVAWFENDKGESIAHKRPEAGLDQLTAMANELVALLVEHGFEVGHADEPFKAHATLKYCDGRNYDGPVPEGGFRVDHINLWGANEEGYELPLRRGRTAAALQSPPRMVEDVLEGIREADEPGTFIVPFNPEDWRYADVAQARFPLVVEVFHPKDFKAGDAAYAPHDRTLKLPIDASYQTVIHEMTHYTQHLLSGRASDILQPDTRGYPSPRIQTGNPFYEMAEELKAGGEHALSDVEFWPRVMEYVSMVKHMVSPGVFARDVGLRGVPRQGFFKTLKERAPAKWRQAVKYAYQNLFAQEELTPSEWAMFGPDPKLPERDAAGTELDLTGNPNDWGDESGAGTRTDLSVNPYGGRDQLLNRAGSANWDKTVQAEANRMLGLMLDRGQMRFRFSRISNQGKRQRDAANFLVQRGLAHIVAKRQMNADMIVTMAPGAGVAAQPAEAYPTEG